jgi:diguanylate cyclase (GGDEF)-like protein
VAAGIARLQGQRWHRYGPPDGLRSPRVRRLAEIREADGSLRLWAATWEAGVFQLHGERWIPDPHAQDLPRDAVLSIAQTRTLGGRLRVWLGMGNQGLWYRDADGAGWRRWRAPGFAAGQVEYLLATAHAGRESLWISGFGTGLSRLDDTGLTHWSREAGTLSSNELYGIAQTATPEGSPTTWVASRAGLVRIHRDRAQTFDRRHGLASDVVRGLDAWTAPGGSPVLWLATEAGVARTIPGADPWFTASLLGSRSIGVFAVLVEPDGRGGERLWVGASEEGLGLYEQGLWRVFTPANSALPDAGISMVRATTDSAGVRTRWVGLWSGELLRVRDTPSGPVFEREDTPWRKGVGQAVLDTLSRRFEGRDERWVATRRDGAHRWRDGRWTSMRPPGVRGDWRVGNFQTQRDAAGQHWLWAGTSHGLARFDGRSWTLFGRDAGLPTDELLGVRLYPDGNGRPVLWLGSSGAGIVRVDVSDPRTPRTLADDLPTPPDRTVYSVLRDSTGRMYACTNNGVQQLEPHGAGWRSAVFMRQHGMVHDECNTNAQLVDAHDRFWTGTLGGLTVYDPRRAVRDTQPKPLRLVGMRIDGTPVAGASLRVPAGAKEIEVDFALLSWQREGASRFRSQLVGYDAMPGAWTAQATRTFNALPPGDYLLRVEARDHAGNASVPLQVPMSIGARWWQHAWVAAAGVAALLLLGYAVALQRTRALRTRQRELERHVAERTADLHTANARLTDLSYRDALTGLANRRRLLEALDARCGATGPAHPTSLVLADVDHFKAYNDRHGHPAGDEALRAVADTLTHCMPEGTLVARFGGEEFACLLPDTTADQAARIAERCRGDIAERDIAIAGTRDSQRVTVSMGVAGGRLAHPDDGHRLIRDADAALYRAKREGRDRVRVSGHDASPAA